MNPIFGHYSILGTISMCKDKLMVRLVKPDAYDVTVRFGL